MCNAQFLARRPRRQLTALPACLDLPKVHGQLLIGSPEFYAPCLRRGNALRLPLTDEFTFCLRHIAQKLEHDVRDQRMVIVVPVDKLKGNDEALRLQAWGEVSELLRPGLGKLYRQFNPSGSAWERKYPRPFGVVLGWQEPEVFRELLKAGEEAQHEAVAFHLEAMLRKADLGSAQKIGDTQVYSAVVDGSDPELLAHGVWHILMQKGTPVPDCGIYYAALHRASATEEERREVIDHADEYAACMVVLSQGVKASA